MLPPQRAATDGGAGGSGLSVVDYRSGYLITPPGTGTLTAEFEPVPSGCLWLLQRITVMCTSTTATQAIVYAGYPNPQNYVDATDRGNLDVADEAQPILIESNVPLVVQWTGASAGSQGTVRVQYQLVTRA